MVFFVPSPLVLPFERLESQHYLPISLPAIGTLATGADSDSGSSGKVFEKNPSKKETAADTTLSSGQLHHGDIDPYTFEGLSKCL